MHARLTLASRVATAVIGLAILATPVVGHALSFGAVVTEGTVGTGANEAMIVIDWQDGLTPTHAWLYRWDGAASYADAYADITLFEGGAFSWSPGNFVSFMDYSDDDGDVHVTTNTFWLSFWESTDGENWMTLGGGVEDQLLVDGGWAGANPNLPVDGWPGVAPTVPVPEPGTAVLLGLGLVGLAGRRSRRC